MGYVQIVYYCDWWELVLHAASKCTHPDSFNRLRSTAVATASWSTFEGTMRVLWCYCNAVLTEYPHIIVPLKVLQFAGATVVLHYMGPTQPVMRNLDVLIVFLNQSININNNNNNISIILYGAFCQRIQIAAAYYYGIRKIFSVILLHLRVLLAKCTPHQH